MRISSLTFLGLLLSRRGRDTSQETRTSHGDNEVWSQGNEWGDLTAMFVFVR
jgi:hypothetical protein